VTHAAWYPPADRSQDRSKFSGIKMPRITKLLLHSTESAGWPSYPDFAPQFTFDPWGHKWRQHMPLPLSASTLADSSSTAVRENRDDIVQVEIVGYCDEAQADKHGRFVEGMDAEALKQLGAFAAWLHVEWGLPLTSTVTWKSYKRGNASGSYGLNNGVRLTGPQFDAYTGLLGHQHAPAQRHGDPGRIDVAAILAAAKGSTPVPAEYPTPKTDDVYLSKLHLGQLDSDSVWQLQAALKADGYDVPLSGDYDKATAAAVARCVFDGGGKAVTIHNDL